MCLHLIACLVSFPDSASPRCCFASSLALTGCIEGQGTVRVNSLKFTGVKAVKPGQLKSVLATMKSSSLPWGTKHYFTREQFEADLKRIVAFYKDRGYPDAKVRSFDVKLNDKQDAVDVTVNVDEGQPVLVELVEYVGFDTVPPARLASLRSRGPLRGGRAAGPGARAGSSRERARRGEGERLPVRHRAAHRAPGPATIDSRVLTLTATPGTLARIGNIEITGNTSVSDNVVQRQLTFRPNWRYRLSQAQESQRRLYGLETFQFANIEPVLNEGRAARDRAGEGHRRLRASTARWISAWGTAPRRRRAPRSTGATSTSSAARGRCSSRGPTRR